MYGIYGNIYHQYTPNVTIHTIHGSYGNWESPAETVRINRLETGDTGDPGQSIHLYFGRWLPLGQSLPIYRTKVAYVSDVSTPRNRGGNLEKSEKLVDVNPTYPLVI